MLPVFVCLQRVDLFIKPWESLRSVLPNAHACKLRAPQGSWLIFCCTKESVEKRIDNKHAPSSHNHQTIGAFSPLPLVQSLHFNHIERSRHLTLSLNPNVSCAHAQAHALCNSNLCLEALPGVSVSRFSSCMCLWSELCLCVRLSDRVYVQAQGGHAAELALVRCSLPLTQCWCDLA